ncbi:MAG: hypothetical protein LUE88_05425 [Clostridiales bacterium]|nr:hypothetical protein [Clostridiales bacterium]
MVEEFISDTVKTMNITDVTIKVSTGTFAVTSKNKQKSLKDFCLSGFAACVDKWRKL